MNFTKMKSPKKRYSVSGTFENPLSESQNLQKLNTNILNYIKLKGIKYHNISNSNLEQDLLEEKGKGKEKEKEKVKYIHTIKEENEQNNYLRRNYRSNSQKSFKRKILNLNLLEKNNDIQEQQKDNLKDFINNNNNKIFKENIKKNIKKTNSTDYIIEEKNKKKIKIYLERENNIDLDIKKNVSKRRSVIINENKDKKKEKIQVLFRKFYRQLQFSQIQFEKLKKFCDIMKIYKLKFKEEKEKFINNLKKIYEIPLIYNIRKNLNHHKPIIKQKRKINSSTSLNNISIYFLPSNIDDDLLSLQNDFTSKNLDIFSLKLFYDIEFSKENSFFYRAKNYHRQNSDEILKYKRLYEMARESLSKYKKEIKTFNFLSIRIKNINLNFPSSKPSSFKNIEYENLDYNKFTINAIKKEFNIHNLQNFEILGLKKNPYLWTKLPLTIKKLVKQYIYFANSEFFILYLKKLYLQKKKKEILDKIFKRKELKIKRKFLKEFEFKIRLIKYLEEKGKEKINIYQPKKEISFEIEKSIYEPSYLSDSNSEIKKLNYSFISSKSLKLEKSKFKLDYIPKRRNPKIKIQKSIINSRIHIMKRLLRNERKRNRKLNYIDKKDFRNSYGKKYKPVKFIKKVYDNVTGNIIKRHLRQPSDLINNNSEEEYLFSNEDIKAEEILNEDKYSKMKRVLKFNQVNHYFKFWKSFIKKKNKKPKFFDIIIIIMKCLFTNNNFIKDAFMGELYFIKGRYLFIWYFNVFRERKKKKKIKK